MVRERFGGPAGGMGDTGQGDMRVSDEGAGGNRGRGTSQLYVPLPHMCHDLGGPSSSMGVEIPYSLTSLT